MAQVKSWTTAEDGSMSLSLAVGAVVHVWMAMKTQPRSRDTSSAGPGKWKPSHVQGTQVWLDQVNENPATFKGHKSGWTRYKYLVYAHTHLAFVYSPMKTPTHYSNVRDDEESILHLHPSPLPSLEESASPIQSISKALEKYVPKSSDMQQSQVRHLSEVGQLKVQQQSVKQPSVKVRTFCDFTVWQLCKAH